jgi:hypothetical protein
MQTASAGLTEANLPRSHNLLICGPSVPTLVDGSGEMCGWQERGEIEGTPLSAAHKRDRAPVGARSYMISGLG